VLLSAFTACVAFCVYRLRCFLRLPLELLSAFTAVLHSAFRSELHSALRCELRSAFRFELHSAFRFELRSALRCVLLLRDDDPCCVLRLPPALRSAVRSHLHSAFNSQLAICVCAVFEVMITACYYADTMGVKIGCAGYAYLIVSYLIFRFYRLFSDTWAGQSRINGVRLYDEFYSRK
jgi:hypothetical protein